MTADPVLDRSGGSVARPVMGSQRHTTWVILITALVARIIILAFTLVNYPHDWLYSRGIEMGLLAKSLLHGLGYSSPFGGATGPTAFIAPGYPTLIAAIFFVFGMDSSASAIAIMAMHILFGLATIWLIMQVARELFDFPTATLAGIFWAIALPPLFLMTIFWDTNISCCAMLGMISFALRCRRQPGTRLWIAMGATCAVIALINPALLPSMFAILCWTAWQTWRVNPRGPVLGALALLTLFSPWPIRNAMRFHAFIPLRSTVGFELWMGNQPGATGFLNESIFPMYNKPELDQYIAQGEVAYTQEKSKEAKAYIRSHPSIFVKLTLRRIVRFWSGTGNSPSSLIFAIHATVTTLLGFTGLWFMFRRRLASAAWLFALPLLVFPLPYYITHAEFRYRIVIDPLLTILAAYAITQIAAEKKPAVPDALPAHAR
jgi:hypothetical protein